MIYVLRKLYIASLQENQSNMCIIETNSCMFSEKLSSRNNYTHVQTLMNLLRNYHRPKVVSIKSIKKDVGKSCNIRMKGGILSAGGARHDDNRWGKVDSTE